MPGPLRMVDLAEHPEYGAALSPVDTPVVLSRTRLVEQLVESVHQIPVRT